MTLASGVVYALVDIVGARHVVLACDGCTTVGSDALDAVVFPGSGGEVAEILRGATACDIAVRLPGVGVVRPGSAGEIALALTRLDKVRIDRPAMVARVQPLILAERLLRTLSQARLQLAAAITTQPRAADMVGDCAVAIETVTASGQIVRATRTSCGNRPDMLDLLPRIAGVSCVITEITLALLPSLDQEKE